MTEEEKKAVEYLKKYINWETYGERNLEADIETVLNLIQKQQEEIEKKDKYIKDMCENYCPKLMTKDKIIDLIARAWKQDDERSVEEIIQYFTQKAEEII